MTDNTTTHTDIKAHLLRTRTMATRDVDVDGQGTVVRVRGLKRGEVLEIRAAATKHGKLNANLVDLFTIAWSLVDPVMTPDEVAEWAEHAPAGELARVMEACGELTGMLDGADKSGVPGVRG